MIAPSGLGLSRAVGLHATYLVRDGLVKRTVFPVVPPRVDYELTDLGRGLAEPVQALGKWAFEHLPEIQGARTNFDARSDKG